MGMSWLKNLIEKITIKLNFNRVNSPSLKVKSDTKIENKADEVRTQIGQVNIQHGLTYSEATDLIISVTEQRLVAFKSEAKTIYEDRAKDFAKLVIEKIKDLPESEISKLREPDTQLALMEATKISGRRQDEELRKLLANLVVSRIKNDSKEELKNIVYNEAISTINKLTVNQLKIITLCFLLRYTSNPSINSWGAFQNYLNNVLQPFLKFKNTNAEFQHIEYAGCGSIGIGSWDFLGNFRDNYSFLFFNLFEKKEIDDLELPEEIKKEIVEIDPKEDKYLLKVTNKVALDKYLRGKGLAEDVVTKFVSMYEGHIRSASEAGERIAKETELGKELVEACSTQANISHLSLTSVGIAIAVSYLEQTVGQKADIGIWIN